MAGVGNDSSLLEFAAFSRSDINHFQMMNKRVGVKKNFFFPGSNCPCVEEDFIIVAEFSEVTGPIPLLTIPSKLDSLEENDINALIMKIMSVDYQANPSGQFAFCQDVQVMQCEVLPGRCAYIHYCTLYDLQARGFVRPLCLAYISADYIKLKTEFNKLRNEFHFAIEILKYNNRQTFIAEINNILENMKKLQKKYFSFKKKEEDGKMLSVQECQQMACLHVDQLAYQQSELCHMLLTAETLQDDCAKEKKLLHWRRALEYSCEAECQLFVSCVRAIPSVCTSLSVSLGPPGSREPMRPVATLSPWGMVIMLWHLLFIQRSLSRCRLLTPFSMFSSDYRQSQLVDSAVEALSDGDFLQLLVRASQPLQCHQEVIQECCPNDGLRLDSLEYIDANLMAGGIEASSSYHSALDSLSEIIISGCGEEEEPSCCRTLSCESFLDAPTNSDCNDFIVEEQADVPEAWISCAWSTDVPLGSNVAGRHLLQFSQQYSQVAQHVVLSLLIGRTVVVAGGEAQRSRVHNSLLALSALIPSSSPHILWWHHGILVSSHISSHHLIGLCVPERLSVHDMISPHDKNCVTILEVANGRFWGPAYSGKLLAPLEMTSGTMLSDRTLLLLLRFIGDILREKLCLVLSGSFSSVREALNCLDFTNCDAEILRSLLHLDINF